MVDVQDDKAPLMKRPEGVQEENAVGASGNGHTERTTGYSQPVQRRCHFVEHASR